MNRNLEKLALEVDSRIVIHPCVEIMALSALPRTTYSSGYVRFYEAFARRYRGKITHYQLSDSTKWKRFEPKDEAKVPSWFSDERSLKVPALGIIMHTQAKASDVQPPAFEMFFEHAWPEYPRGMFRIVLPVDAIGEDAASVLELVDDAMAEIPVHWGTAGYAFHWDSEDPTTDEYAERWLGRHLLRHPGLAPGNLIPWGAGVEEGVANIGWITFIGDWLIDKLGGQETLAASAAGAGIGLRQYARGVALQAGDVPQLGDVNRKDHLPAYREVGKILQPVFAPDERLDKILVTGLDDDDDARLAWLRRFLP